MDKEEKKDDRVLLHWLYSWWASAYEKREFCIGKPVLLEGEICECTDMKEGEYIECNTGKEMNYGFRFEYEVDEYKQVYADDGSFYSGQNNAVQMPVKVGGKASWVSIAPATCKAIIDESEWKLEVYEPGKAIRFRDGDKVREYIYEDRAYRYVE